MFVLVLGACGSSGGGDTLGTLDPRCSALCASSDATCSGEVTDCQNLCQVRVAGMASTCATCLLDGSNGGSCAAGQTCCPDPHFAAVMGCADPCKDSQGVNPSGTHPICADLCATTEASCSTQAASCVSECQARIAGVSGLCALCLLQGASGGNCSSGMVCCPNPSFPMAVSACSAFCG
jgi:hypothetical protein